MGLKGKMTTMTEVKCHGDIFHDLFRHKPHHLSKLIPDKVQDCQLHEGEFGTLGSVNLWKYTHEGKEKVMKTVIESIDEEKKIVTFKATEGDVLEHYKKFNITLHVETHKSHKDEDDEHLVSWSFDYEKKTEDSPAPTSCLNYAHSITKDIEIHHVKKDIEIHHDKKDIEIHDEKKDYEFHHEKKDTESHHHFFKK